MAKKAAKSKMEAGKSFDVAQGRPDIDTFEAVMMHEDRQKRFFVSFDFSSDADGKSHQKRQ